MPRKSSTPAATVATVEITSAAGTVEIVAAPVAAVAVRQASNPAALAVISLADLSPDRLAAVAASTATKPRAIPVFEAAVSIEGEIVSHVNYSAGSAASVLDTLRDALNGAGGYGDALLGAVAYRTNGETGKTSRVRTGAEKGVLSAANRSAYAIGSGSIGLAIRRLGFVPAA